MIHNYAVLLHTDREAKPKVLGALEAANRKAAEKEAGRKVAVTPGQWLEILSVRALTRGKHWRSVVSIGQI